MSLNLDTLKGLSIERLQTLCLVAAKGGITKAAAGNPNKQSLFSRQIKELESALGVQLLNRGQTPRCLTADGERVERAARVFLAQLRDVSSAAGQGRVEIVIGAGESIIQWLLIPRLRHLLLSSRFGVIFRNLPSRAIVDQLLSQRLDLGVVRKSALRGTLQCRSLGMLGMKAAVSKRHLPSLARKQSLSWGDAAARPWVILEGDGDFRTAVLAQAQAHGVTPDIAAQCTSYGQVMDALRAGPMIGFLPDFLFDAAREDIVPLEFEAAGAHKREMALAWHPAALKRRPELETVIEVILPKRRKSKQS